MGDVVGYLEGFGTAGMTFGFVSIPRIVTYVKVLKTMCKRNRRARAVIVGLKLEMVSCQEILLSSEGWGFPHCCRKGL